MSTRATETRIQLEQKYAEDLVRAEGALKGERWVAWTRLILFCLLGIATELGGRLGPAEERAAQTTDRAVLLVCYFAFTLSALVITHRLKNPEPRKALVIPIFTTLADAGFFALQGVIGWRLDEPARPGVMAAIFSVLICFSVARSRLFHVIGSTALSIACVTGLSLLTHSATWAWTSFICFCMIGLGVLIGATNARLGTMFDNMRQRENLSRFLPRQVVDRVIKGAGKALLPVQREVTILFSDIRDFTQMSEHLPPGEVLAFLDDYFGHMGQIVRGHDGMVNKFIGDGLLAVWGVPDLQPDHADRAMKAALDMRKKMVELNEHRVREGVAALRIGIGLHTGLVAAGMLGGADQSEYTVIGDAVNLASRIEGLNKGLGTDILASEATWQQCKGRFDGERVSEEKVKGRAAAVVVYSVKS